MNGDIEDGLRVNRIYKSLAALMGLELVQCCCGTRLVTVQTIVREPVVNNSSHHAVKTCSFTLTRIFSEKNKQKDKSFRAGELNPVLLGSSCEIA